MTSAHSEISTCTQTVTLQTAPRWEWRYSAMNPCSIQRPDPVKTHAQVLQDAINTTKNDLLTESVAAEYHAAMKSMLATRLVRLKEELSKEIQPLPSRPVDTSMHVTGRFPSELRQRG